MRETRKREGAGRIGIFSFLFGKEKFSRTPSGGVISLSLLLLIFWKIFWKIFFVIFVENFLENFLGKFFGKFFLLFLWKIFWKIFWENFLENFFCYFCGKFFGKFFGQISRGGKFFLLFLWKIFWKIFWKISGGGKFSKKGGLIRWVRPNELCIAWNLPLHSTDKRAAKPASKTMRW